jgi:hypothetical protein
VIFKDSATVSYVTLFVARFLLTRGGKTRIVQILVIIHIHCMPQASAELVTLPIDRHELGNSLLLHIWFKNLAKVVISSPVLVL